ncbi:ABC transporter ATP-binding protein [Facklamia sp. DSM 111018]|uniref:ABC transporter ATP-binding protein n=1 Tax=Facklamia lactis TaxID=2749967 RepID=A0ABS0LQ31_9LACT|nr:ABC transporter ATP-binding protein [Facklamia lactis]MBG9986183.1 ABC transporter ATP-binding protein [Facklamia lactis]
MAKITLKSISKTYNKSKANTFNLFKKKRSSVSDFAVRNLSVEIPDGSFTAIIGPSGCGKSTTLRMIAGLESVDSGEVWIGDRLINSLPPGDRNISMVFQNYALYPMMTVKENITFGLEESNLTHNEMEERTKKVAEIVELTEFLDRKPSQLSGGQQQRVALARAIAKNPDLYIFDEPLSNLDAKLRTDMRSRLISMHEQLQATFIYVTHDQIEAMSMADQIIILNDGKVMQIGSPYEVYNDPFNLFVANFIGNPGMNLIAQLNERITWGFRPERGTLITEDFFSNDSKETYFLDTEINSTQAILNPKSLISNFLIESKILTREYLGSEFLYTINNIFGIQKVKSENIFDKNQNIFLHLNRKDLYYFDQNGDRIRNTEVE